MRNDEFNLVLRMFRIRQTAWDRIDALPLYKYGRIPMCEFILEYNNYSTFLLILNKLFKYPIPLKLSGTRRKIRMKERSVE